VYGDIGTSPLYTLKEVFSGHYGVQANTAGVLGVLSLVFWSLIWVVSIKYVLFILRASNQGEGGIMALTALAHRARRPMRVWARAGAAGPVRRRAVLRRQHDHPGDIGALGGGGLQLAFDGIEHWVVPLSVVVLVALFVIQKHGTARIGILFGPVMVLWFVVLGALGVRHRPAPEVLQALNPAWAVQFFVVHPGMGVAILGAVVLALTGAEALYADMGHFGRKPARAWFLLVLPGLVLNYFGQRCLATRTRCATRSTCSPPTGPAAHGRAGHAGHHRLPGGDFRRLLLTRQAIQLGYMPRMFIQHTSSASRGRSTSAWSTGR
jgi:KUP system potassium uptake protein